jgi:hypothetical protein
MTDPNVTPAAPATPAAAKPKATRRRKPKYEQADLAPIVTTVQIRHPLKDQSEPPAVRPLLLPHALRLSGPTTR